MQASIDFDGTLTGSIAGGGGGGSDVSITPTYQQGVKIADYSIDGNEGTIYTPEIEITKYVNSGIKICEINDVKIFTPSCGYIDTLSDSNVEQIGGFSQGANVTPVNVKKVSYINDVANGDKIGTLTVGNTLYNVYQKPNSSINYSTTEQNTALLWYDGRHIYQKTFEISVTSSLVNISVSGLNIDILLSIEGISVGAEHQIFTPYYESSNYYQFIEYDKENNNLQVYSGNSVLPYYDTTYVTIRYVKEVV